MSLSLEWCCPINAWQLSIDAHLTVPHDEVVRLAAEAFGTGRAR